MLEIIFLFTMALIWIIFATIQDLKTREIANWLNFSLIIFALGFRFFYSLFNLKDLNTFFIFGVFLSMLFFGFPLLIYNIFEKKYSKLIKIFKDERKIEYPLIAIISLSFFIWILFDLIKGFPSSVFFNGGLMFFYQGLLGLGIFFVLGNIFYYARFFAGGDAKLMIALGAVFPLHRDFISNISIFYSFFIIFFITGAFYTIFMSLYISSKNSKKFKNELGKQLKKNKKVIYPVLFFGLIVMLAGFLYNLVFYLGILIFAAPYIYIYAKAIDESCMVKKVKTSQLTEGDWLYKDIRIGKKIIRANWDGLSKENIKQLKKKYKDVLIRQGIPFTPVFLISFLVFGLFI